MDRGASAAFLTELLKSTNSPCYLLDVFFDDGTISMTDAWKPVTYGGSIYSEQGHFLSFSGLTETADLQVPSLNITLSAVDQAWISIALTKPYIDRKVVMRKAFLDYTQSLVTSPIIIFQGGLDSMVVSDSPDGTCTIGITATSQWGDFDRKPGRHTNSLEQQVYFPGDRFFDYCADLNRQIKWGAV